MIYHSGRVFIKPTWLKINCISTVIPAQKEYGYPGGLPMCCSIPQMPAWPAFKIPCVLPGLCISLNIEAVFNCVALLYAVLEVLCCAKYICTSVLQAVPRDINQELQKTESQISPVFCCLAGFGKSSSLYLSHPAKIAWCPGVSQQPAGCSCTWHSALAARKAVRKIMPCCP